MTKNNEINQLQQQVQNLQKQVQANNVFKNSSMFKRMQNEIQQWFDGKQQELNTALSHKQFIQDSISKMMVGNPQHREASILKNVDGVLMRVSTDNYTNVTSVEPVSSFEQLSERERTQLFQDNKRVYKQLQHNVYKPELTTRHIDLMVDGEGLKYEHFSLVAETPQKPSLDGLNTEDCQKEISEYQTAKLEHDTKLSNYLKEKETYQTGTMQQQLRDSEDNINNIRQELESGGL
jgi:hypothetical protein